MVLDIFNPLAEKVNWLTCSHKNGVGIKEPPYECNSAGTE